MDILRSRVVISLAVASLAATMVVLAAPAANARTASSIRACKLLSAKQVAALHIGTSCTQNTGRPNPYYQGVSATWGKLRGHGSVIVSVNKVYKRAYISLWESQNAKKGKSVGVGSWSRGTCAQTGSYCIVDFVVHSYVVELQVAPPTGHRLASSRPVVALAKTVATRLG